jgi:hypothetical protein
MLSRAQGTACGKRGGSSLRRAREGLGVVVVVTRRSYARRRQRASLPEKSENGLVLRETSSSKSSHKVQFGQEICPKCATLDLGKGPLENVLSFPNLKFSLDEKNCTGGCGIFYFNNSQKFEQNDLLQSTEGVSLVDTWIVSSIIRFTNIPIYYLATTSGSIRLSYRPLPRRQL